MAKEYKKAVVDELERMSSEYHAIMLRNAALNVGITHLKTQESLEVLKMFVKLHPEFKIYRLADNPKASIFCASFVSDNETVPMDEMRA